MKWQGLTGRRLHTEWLLGAAAIVAGVTGTYLAQSYIAQRTRVVEERFTQRYAPRSIVVAASDVKAGASLDVSTLAARSVPAAFVPSDAVPAERAATVLAKRALIDIKRGSPIQQGALRSLRTVEGLSAAVEDGRRAFTIAVNQITSLDGQLSAGDHVDIYLSQSETEAARLTPLLQNVLVLAAGGRIHGADASEPAYRDASLNTVTLSLTADDAARLILAEQVGTLSILLRAPQDVRPADVLVRDSRQLQPGTYATGTRRRPAERIELLIGGAGSGLDRRWLVVGSTVGIGVEGAAP